MGNTIDYGDWYLYLPQLNNLTLEDKKVIHDYYRDMLSCSSDTNLKSLARSYFNTLFSGGYIKNILQEQRNDKIEIING